MDNITHALAGALLAEAACVWRRETRPEVRAVAQLASALANNLPDIDIAYTWITGPKPLGSLLHHRGHTHTLLVALPCAYLLGLAIWRWLATPHAANAAAGRRDRQLILGLCLLGPLVHLTMDFGNNYGVHPFWPLSGRWFYGDSIFIIEPLWWAIAIPVVVATLRRRWTQLVLWVVLAAILIVCWYVPFVPTASRVALLAVTGASALVARRGSARTRVSFALGGCLAVAALFVAGSVLAKAQLRRATEAAFPALSVLDIAATPMPANPSCWEGLVAGEQGGTYRVVRASVAIAPFAAESCRAGSDVMPTAPVRQLDRPTRYGVRFRSEYRAELSELRQLRRDDCRFRALLQFARLPYVARTESTDNKSAASAGTVAGDLRYDRAPDLDFSDLRLPSDPRSGRCPRLVPGWSEPRSELFRP